MDAVGIIFANIHDDLLPQLTIKRTLASVPFGGRYRLIDFPLSSMVNSGIFKVGVATRANYQSLMDHLESGKDWDLARRTGGLYLLPPHSFNEGGNTNANRLEALSSSLNFITRSEEEYVLLCDGDCVFNIDFNEMLNYHISKGNDITLAYKEMYFDKAMASHKSSVEVDKDDNITGLLVHRMEEGRALANLNIMFLKRELLIKLINNAVSRGQRDFQHDIIGKNIKHLKIGGFRYDGLFYFIDSLPRYFSANMSLLDRGVNNALFNTPYRPIYTKVKDSAPTKFFQDAKVFNSSIADGCEIKGTVENCLLFRDVFVSEGAVLKNCLVMQNGFIGENCIMEYCLLDKNVTVNKDNILRGSYNLPYVVGKGVKV